MTRFLLRLMIALSLGCSAVIGGTILAGRALRAKAPELAYLDNPPMGFSTLMLLDVERRLAIPLAQNVMLSRTAWSPDGTRLLFSAAQPDLFKQVWVMLLDLRDGQLVPLTLLDGNSYLPVWSPDGTQAAFVTLTETGWGLYIQDVPSDTREVVQAASSRRLLKDGYTTVGGAVAWSADGRQIAFQASENINVNLYAADIADGTVRILVNNIGVYGGIAWLPDGERLVYTQFNIVQSDLALVDVRDGSLDMLTQPPYFDSAPALAPDGRTLAYISFTTRNTLYTLDVETGATRAITNVAGINDYPLSWSPDGAWLAFSALRAEGEFVYRARADGSDVQRLTFGGRHNGRHDGQGDRTRHVFPAWRP